jgi:hypothetical protein
MKDAQSHQGEISDPKGNFAEGPILVEQVV